MNQLVHYKIIVRQLTHYIVRQLVHYKSGQFYGTASWSLKIVTTLTSVSYKASIINHIKCVETQNSGNSKSGKLNFEVVLMGRWFTDSTNFLKSEIL